MYHQIALPTLNALEVAQFARLIRAKVRRFVGVFRHDRTLSDWHESKQKSLGRKFGAERKCDFKLAYCQIRDKFDNPPSAGGR
jgi:hypothetical protein